MKNQEDEYGELKIEFDDVCTYLFEKLTERGYAPDSDELLDLTDIVMDLTLAIHTAMGGEVVTVVRYDEDEDEDDFDFLGDDD